MLERMLIRRCRAKFMKTQGMPRTLEELQTQSGPVTFADVKDARKRAKFLYGKPLEGVPCFGERGNSYLVSLKELPGWIVRTMDQTMSELEALVGGVGSSRS